MGFIFGGDTGMSYEDIQRKRKVADALIAQNSRTPKNVGEGLHAVGRALMARGIEKRASARDKELSSEADALFDAAFGGSSSDDFSAAPEATMPDGSAGVFADTYSGNGKGDPSERELLAKTLMAEAGGEGLHGMLAAGAVINNRMKSGSYGGSLKDVIMAPGQFSAWNSVTGYAGGEGGLDMSNMRANQEAYRAADMILSGQAPDPTGGATHYYNPAAADPKWGQKAGGDWTRIGNHVFGSADGRPGAGGQRSAPQRGGNTAAIIKALSNPYIAKDPGKRAMLMNALTQAQQANDPMRSLQIQAAQQNLRLGDIKINEAMNPPAPDRKIIKGADGFNYYQDSGERVLPNVTVPEEAKKPLTEGQAKMTLFKSMQDETAPVLTAMEKVYDPSNLKDAAARSTPIAGKFFESADGKQYTAAASAWVEGALRLATGAAATPEEFDRTLNTYFARPGDSPDVITFKASLRDAYSRTVRRALGEGDVQGQVPIPAAFAQGDDAPKPPANAASQSDISSMSREDIARADISKMSPEELRAFSDRMTELGL